MKRLLIRIKRHIKTSKNPKSPIQASSDLVPDWDRPRETSRPKIEISSSDGPKDVQNQHNPLDSLPAEIRRHLLFILDLAQLKTLVFASPTFHEQYLLDRQSILCRSLETTLPSTVVDAKAVYEFSLVSTLKKDIPAFLLSYAENVKQRYSSPANRLILDEAIGMASFYFRSVKPIVEYYARWALDNLSRSLGQICHSHDVEVALTTMETVRLARAVYRFELLCQLVNPVDRPFNIPRERFIRSLFDIIEPWEVEELVSFYQFAQSIYDGAFRDVRWDLHMNNPKFDGQGRPPTPEGAFDLDNSFERDCYLEGTTLRGLSLLRTVLFKIQDHRHLVSTMQQHIVSSYIPISDMSGFIGTTDQELRRRHRPTDRDRLQDERSPLPFRGDDFDGPPISWTIIWRETYSNLYGYFLPDELRQWGYVFWDAATLETVGGRQALKAQWEAYSEDYDPRDDMF